jgi:hypothetical protein
MIEVCHPNFEEGRSSDGGVRRSGALGRPIVSQKSMFIDRADNSELRYMP